MKQLEDAIYTQLSTPSTNDLWSAIDGKLRFGEAKSGWVEPFMVITMVPVSRDPYPDGMVVHEFEAQCNIYTPNKDTDEDADDAAKYLEEQFDSQELTITGYAHVDTTLLAPPTVPRR